MKRITKIFALSALVAVSSACSDFLDTPPQDKLLEGEALQTPDDYEALLNSCYDVTANYFNGRFQIMNDLLSDNMARPVSQDDYLEVYNYNVLFFNGTIGTIYAEPYIAVYRINSMLERLGEIELPEDLTNRINAEGRFLRGLAHFELVKLWAQPYGYTADNSHPGIVIKTTTSTALVGRNTVQEVYAQVLSDLQYAEQNLPASNGVYADRWAAKAALAKVYFQMNNYSLAEQYASEVIASGNYSLGTSVDRFTETVSPEAIFSTVSFVTPDQRDTRSGVFTGGYRVVGGVVPALRATKEFYDQYAGNPDDARLAFFQLQNPDQPNELVAVYKFDKDYFNVPVLHLTDMHLLRAEALLYLSSSNAAAAAADVNLIRERAYGATSPLLLDPNSATASEVLQAVRFERRIEMFGEGDRIQQLKRRGASGEAITVRGGAPWNCPGMVIQFPISEKTDLFEMNQTGGCL